MKLSEKQLKLYKFKIEEYHDVVHQKEYGKPPRYITKTIVSGIQFIYNEHKPKGLFFQTYDPDSGQIGQAVEIESIKEYWAVLNAVNATINHQKGLIQEVITQLEKTIS